METPLFDSFWMAGFEGACHVNRHGTRLDMLAATQHDRQAEADYARLREFGIRVARDGVRWHLVDRGGRYDFSSFAPMLAAAQRQGIQVIWTLCHYGFPDDLELLDPRFVERFAAYCRAVAEFVAAHSDRAPSYTPVNEISFLAWAGNTGYIYPQYYGRGPELKRQLVRAAIAGMNAILEVDPRARFIHVDPIYHVVPPRGRPDLEDRALAQIASQYEAWDMIAGRRDQDLGGDPRYLDVIGVNFYHANEWEWPGEGPDDRLRWEDTPRDARWVPLHQLIAKTYRRYQRPILIAETSHFGVGRGPWISEIADEVLLALEAGVPLEGVCIYPIIDRPDWDDPNHWHNSGLWDLIPDERGELRRVLSEPYAEALRAAQQRVQTTRAAA
ncbi:MAG: hypothetical protein DIU80_012160 [Chloroflexota bacterium]